MEKRKRNVKLILMDLESLELDPFNQYPSETSARAYHSLLALIRCPFFASCQPYFHWATYGILSSWQLSDRMTELYHLNQQNESY